MSFFIVMLFVAVIGAMAGAYSLATRHLAGAPTTLSWSLIVLNLAGVAYWVARLVGAL